MTRGHRPRLVLALALALPLAPAMARAEDLLAVLAGARAADPAWQQAGLAVQQRVEDQHQARAAFFPQARLDGQWARQQGVGGGAASTLRGVSAQLSQVLLDLAQGKRLDAAQARRVAEEAQRASAGQALIERSARLYLQRLTAEALWAAQQASEQVLAQQVAQTRERVAAGLAARADLAQAETYHALARSQLAQADQARSDAQQALAELLGLAPGPLQPLAEGAPPATLAQAAQAPEALADWLARAAGHPALVALDAQRRAALDDAEALRREHLPTLGLNLVASHQAGAGVAEADRQTRSASLQLSWVPDTAGLRSSRQRQAQLTLAQLEQTREALWRQLQRSVHAQHQGWRAGLQRWQAGDAAVAAAQAAWSSTQAGLRLGTHRMTDLVLAIQSLVQAQAALADAREQTVLAYVGLHQAAGVLDDAVAAEVNRWLQPAVAAQASAALTGHPGGSPGVRTPAGAGTAAGASTDARAASEVSASVKPTDTATAMAPSR